MKKKLFIVIGLILICAIIGYPRFAEYSQPEINNAFYSYNESFPWDLTLWENAKLKCKNSGTSASEIQVSLLGKNDSESMATSFNISAKGSITKKLSKLASLRKEQKSQRGVIIIESENNNITCQIIKLPFKGSTSIDSNDIVARKSYILSTPNVLKNISDEASGRIIIYNLEDSPLNIEIQSYTQAGVADYHKKLKTIGSGKKRILKLKNIAKKNTTYHIIPKEEFPLYFAYLELTDRNGKKYLIKNSYEVENTLITNVKGTLVVTNTSSVPTNFVYAISSKDKKAYQGTEWLMPHSQRIFDLKKYTKSLSSPKMRIEALNFFNEEECTYNEEKKESECFYTSKKGQIAVNFYSKGSQSPIIIKDVSYDKLEKIPSYDNEDYLVQEIPVTCFNNPDTDQDGICDFEEEVFGSNPYEKDTDNDGVDDGVEFSHTFSSSNSADTDGDDYDDFAEYEARTYAFSPDVYPGAPFPDSFESMMELILDDHNNINENKYETEANENFKINTSRSSAFNWWQWGQQFHPIDSFFANLACDTNYGCKKENVCIHGNLNRLSSAGVTLGQFQGIVTDCLRRIKGAITNKADIDCKDNCTITVNFGNKCEGDITRDIIIWGAETKGMIGGDRIWIDPLHPNPLHSNVCRQLAHNFGFRDLNHGIDKYKPRSVVAGGNICISPLDKFFLSYMSGKCRNRENNVSIKSCRTVTGETGYQVVTNNFEGICVNVSEEYAYSSTCEREGCRTYCQEDADSCGECEDRKNPFMIANPKNSNEFACCAKPTAEYCRVKEFENGSSENCCTDTCVNDAEGFVCCKKPIKIGEKRICCDAKRLNASNPKCNINCPKDDPGPSENNAHNIINAKFPIYKDNSSGIFRCCEDKNAVICNGNCCSGECLIRADKTEECCDGENVICNGQCCLANKCLKGDNGKEICCPGDVCGDTCCGTNRVCNEILKKVDNNGDSTKNCNGNSCNINTSPCAGGKCNLLQYSYGGPCVDGKCNLNPYGAGTCVNGSCSNPYGGGTCTDGKCNPFNNVTFFPKDEYIIESKECTADPCLNKENGRIYHDKNTNKLECCEGNVVSIGADNGHIVTELIYPIGICCKPDDLPFYDTSNKGVLGCCDEKKLIPNGKVGNYGYTFGVCCKDDEQALLVNGEFKCRKNICKNTQRFYQQLDGTEACCPSDPNGKGEFCPAPEAGTTDFVNIGRCCEGEYSCQRGTCINSNTQEETHPTGDESSDVTTVNCGLAQQKYTKPDMKTQACCPSDSNGEGEFCPAKGTRREQFIGVCCEGGSRCLGEGECSDNPAITGGITTIPSQVPTNTEVTSCGPNQKLYTKTLFNTKACCPSEPNGEGTFCPAPESKPGQLVGDCCEIGATCSDDGICTKRLPPVTNEPTNGNSTPSQVPTNTEVTSCGPNQTLYIKSLDNTKACCPSDPNDKGEFCQDPNKSNGYGTCCENGFSCKGGGICMKRLPPVTDEPNNGNTTPSQAPTNTGCQEGQTECNGECCDNKTQFCNQQNVDSQKHKCDNRPSCKKGEFTYPAIDKENKPIGYKCCGLTAEAYIEQNNKQYNYVTYNNENFRYALCCTGDEQPVLTVLDNNIMKKTCCSDYRGNSNNTPGYCCDAGTIIYDIACEDACKERHGEVYKSYDGNSNTVLKCCESDKKVCKNASSLYGSCCDKNDICSDDGECLPFFPTISGSQTPKPIPTESTSSTPSDTSSTSGTTTDWTSNTANNTQSGEWTETYSPTTEESAEGSPSGSASLSDNY